MQQKKKKSNAYTAAFIAAGIAIVIFTMIFKLYRWQQYLIAAGAAILVGRIAFIMAQGVDTSKKAPAQQPIPKNGQRNCGFSGAKGPGNAPANPGGK